MYCYYTKIIEDDLLSIYENAEEKAKELVASYVFAKEKRSDYQYTPAIYSKKTEAETIIADAVYFVSRLNELSKTISKELILKRLGKKTL